MLVFPWPHDCPRKADGSAPPYECKKGNQTNDPLIKYKLDVEVYDGDETAKFVLWDNTLDELVGLTASTLLQKMK
ncbi:replication factor A protein, partial [Trifolium medium]|nr:replication factor A protein [Trifolium medium]